MRTIWKFILPIYNDNGNVRARSLIGMPQGARILSFQVQDGKYCLWAEVDSEKPKRTRAFQIVGTGNEMPPDRIEGENYIGTVQNEHFVWHLFEIQFPYANYDILDYATMTKEEAHDIRH